MPEQHLSDDEVLRLLDRLAELNLRCRPEQPWRIERESHDYADGTTHFTHVRTTRFVLGEPAIEVIGSYLSPDVAKLLVTMRNNLSELIRLARVGLAGR